MIEKNTLKKSDKYKKSNTFVAGLIKYINITQMKIEKTLLVVLSAALLGCASPLSKIASTPMDVVPSPALSKPVEPVSDEILKSWPHQNLGASFPGMNLEEAYKLLHKLKSKKVIVGVIDSGIDINHEDLKNVVWVNTNEIPNNNIDDDKNGYVDDIHGWNFLGDVNQATLEFTRIYRNKNKDNPDYLSAKEKYQKEQDEALENKAYVERLHQMVVSADELIQIRLGKKNYTAQDLQKLGVKAGDIMEQYVNFMKLVLSESKDSETLKKELTKGIDYYTSKLNYHLNLTFNPRKEILKDDENDFSKRYYGNNNVIGPDLKSAEHGTHVSGIIAAQRNNNIGMNGVADNVVIMALRAVPDGDEYDKDIALAIRYAVDNGAKVINTSFGKDFSPQKQWVYDAIKYAASKDVLIVNAAGNESKDVDVEQVYPNDEVDGKEISDNFLSVGALNYTFDGDLVADFSNYGKRNVDVFAPGVKIWSTMPDNKYDFLKGTSMASPQVAGLAALIRSYFPNLTASQVKKAIMQSGLKPTIDVFVGTTNVEVRQKKPFSEISTTGSIVNARNAIILAAKMSKKR